MRRCTCRLGLGILVVCTAIGFTSANAADRYDVRTLASLSADDRMATQRSEAPQFAQSWQKECTCPAGSRPEKSRITCTRGETRSGEHPISCEPCTCIRVRWE